MDRRLFVTGLLGFGAATAAASILPRQAEALVGFPSGLPDVTADATAPEPEWDENIEPAGHRRRRRRRRVRRYRRECRRYRHHGHWRRRCRRVPYWAYIFFWI